MILVSLLVCLSTPAPPSGAIADTIHLQIGSKEVNGEVYAPHAARVRVWVGPGAGRMRAEWTNVLALGDSAGKKVHRWVTTGNSINAAGDTITWVLRQTYDAKTLQPYGIARTQSNGVMSAYRIDGRRVTGVLKVSKDSAEKQVSFDIDTPGFVASASDLVPLAVGLKAGTVMVAPIWGPNMKEKSEMRVFSVIGKVDVDVEGTKVNAWKVEERRRSDGGWLANWYLIDKSPYMVYGEVPLPDGSIQRMTEVEIPYPKQ